MKNNLRMILLITVLSLISAISGFAQNSDELMARAKTLIEKQDFTTAIQILNDVIKTNPRNGDAYQLRGDAYQLRGHANVNLDDWENSGKDYTQAINLGTKNARVYENRAKANFLFIKIDQAIVDILQAQKLDPNNENIKSVINVNASAYESIGLKESQSLHWQLASAFYTYAIALTPKYGLYLQRGITNHALGNLAEEIDDFQNAVDLMPNDEMSLNHYLQDAVNDLSGDDFKNILDPRIKMFNEKRDNRVALGSKLATVTDIKTRGTKAEICQVVNNFQTAFGEEKTAFHRMLFIRLRDSSTTTTNLKEIIEALKTDEIGIASNEKQLLQLNKFCQN